MAGVVLYHLTTGEGLRGIEADGIILCTWPKELSEAFPFRIVWLTSQPDPSKQGWKDQHNLRARFVVDISDASPWDDWKQGRRIETVDGLERSTRSYEGGNPSDWHVVERAIPREEWVDVQTFLPPPRAKLLPPHARGGS